MKLPAFAHTLIQIERDRIMDLKGRNFLTLKDFTKEEIVYLLDLAADVKEKKKKGIPVDNYKGKNVALILRKTAPAPAALLKWQLTIWEWELHIWGPPVPRWEKGKHRGYGKGTGRMYDGIEYRGFGQEIVEELAKYAGVPVWNGLTNEYHPTQMLADMLTIREQFGKLEGIKLVYMGDARYNMGNSLMVACSKLGMHFVACTTEKYFPNEELVQTCRGYAEESGATITLTDNVEEGTKDADVIYTDVWVSWVSRMKCGRSGSASLLHTR